MSKEDPTGLWYVPGRNPSASAGGAYTSDAITDLAITTLFGDMATVNMPPTANTLQGSIQSTSSNSAHSTAGGSSQVAGNDKSPVQSDASAQVGGNTQAQQHDITSQQGQTILKEAQSYDGTPYSQNTVPPNNTRGQKGPSSSVDCSHLVCFAANIPYANADGLQRSSHLRPLQAGEQRQAGDVIIFTDAKRHGFHAAFWDPNPPVAGHNVYGATTSRNNPDHNMQWLPLTNSRGQSNFGGTPTFYRLVQ